MKKKYFWQGECSDLELMACPSTVLFFMYLQVVKITRVPPAEILPATFALSHQNVRGTGWQEKFAVHPA